MLKMAKLTESQVSEIRRLEDKWKNVVLLACEKPPEPANLSFEQLKKLRRLEKELGVSLVAYE